jgi:hydroxylamine reductase
MSMFCYQCEQTAKETGCTTAGVCGKTPETAAAQDVLIHLCKGLAWYNHRLDKTGHRRTDIDHFLIEALFTSVTNVNFDHQDIAAMVSRGYGLFEALRRGSDKHPTGFESLRPVTSTADLVDQGTALSPWSRVQALGPDISGLQELTMYGLKGLAAYARHARVLGQEDDSVYAFVSESLAFLADNPRDAEKLTAMALRVGEVNLRVMELLDQANTGAYGHPVPTKVRTTPIAGKCILVSGHDLKDLEELLKQTEGKGINVYTHGEMLPCHGYPGLHKYKHLVGNYGGAWQDQRVEFDAFPGAILMTTNCIQKPKESYVGRLFTSGLVQWPGVAHVGGYDFAPVIKAAMAAPGFDTDADAAFTMTGFGHNAVLGLAGTVIDAVKSGKIRHFFLVGGCDGAKPGRDYYTEFAEAVPRDCVVLTLACGKYRFNKLDFGDIDGIPRLLDVGQCNDAYSAIKIAGALAGAFNCSVNDLPLSLVLSWYEQKAVVILLTLLHLGIRDIRIGPSLPAFVGKSVLQLLVDKFALKPITTAEQDLAAILGKSN